jgi:alkaline phosphatase
MISILKASTPVRLLLGAALAAAVASDASAAPTVSRLTPPSALFTFNDATPPIIARFLPGQKFDLQATVSPTSGASIVSVQFIVDSTSLGTITAAGADTFSGSMSLVTSGLGSAFGATKSAVGSQLGDNVTLPNNTAVASYRAYSNATAGTHTFSVVVTDSAGATTTTATGNFEVVSITSNVGKKVRNIIVMIGDGQGIGHRTAARIMRHGVMQGKANDQLATDKFPITGIVQTASLNSIVTDSAPGAACYSSGNKCNNNEEGVFPDDTVAKFDNPRVENIGEFLKRTQGKSLGIVTTADVFDATPAAFAVHTQDRGAGTGICDQYLDEANKTGLSVLMGGGRKWFLPSTTVGTARATSTDYTLPTDISTGWSVAAGTTGDALTRDLIADFQTAGFKYASSKTTIDTTGTKLLGLFSYSNMNVAKDKIDGRRGTLPAGRTNTLVTDYGFTDQPMLDEMTDAALTVLNKNPLGFVLMVEGASIDKQAHNMDSERWVLDAIEFDNAVAKAAAFANNAANGETLVIVTADHECAGIAIIGASTKTNAQLITAATAGGKANLITGTVGAYEAAKFPQYTIGTDGYPTTTDVDYKMLIGYAANGDRYEDWLTNPLPLQDSQQPSGTASPGFTPYNSLKSSLPALPTNRDTVGNYLVTAQVDSTTAVHTAADIPCYVLGRGAAAFSGTQDNTDLFFKAMQAAIGGANK